MSQDYVQCSGKHTDKSAKFKLKGSIDKFSLRGHQFLSNQRVKMILIKSNSDLVKTEFNTSCGSRRRGRGWYTGNHQYRSDRA